MAADRNEALRARAELAMTADPGERRPRLLRLLGWALTDFDVASARSYLDELESDAGLPHAWRSQVALHRGAFEVLAGRLPRATPVFRGLVDAPDLPAAVRAEAARGLALVGFEQLARPGAPAATENKAGFWRFIDVLIACERGEDGALGSLVQPLDHAPARSTYLATAHALGCAVLADAWRADGPEDRGLPAALREARAAVDAAADQGAARLATACWILGVLEGRAGAHERALAALLEAERLLHPDTFQALSARGERALVLLEMGATDAAATLATEVLERAEERGAHLRAAVAHAALAEVARRRSRPGEAEARALRALDLLRSGDARGVLRRLGSALGSDDRAPAPSIDSGRRHPALDVGAPSDARVARVLSRIRALLDPARRAALGGEASGTAGTPRTPGTPGGIRALGANALARHAGCCREHLTRRVAADLGLSLRELVLRERLAAAMSRLEGGEPAEAVALSLGWSEARAMRRALLRVTGRRVREVRPPAPSRARAAVR